MRHRKPFVIAFFQGIVNIVFTIIEILLFCRLILVFFNANQTNQFVEFIYKYSGVLVAPFGGVFKQITIFDEFVLDLDTIFAWIVYLIIYVVIMEILKLFSSLIINARSD